MRSCLLPVQLALPHESVQNGCYRTHGSRMLLFQNGELGLGAVAFGFGGQICITRLDLRRLSRLEHRPVVITVGAGAPEDFLHPDALQIRTLQRLQTLPVRGLSPFQLRLPLRFGLSQDCRRLAHFRLVAGKLLEPDFQPGEVTP